MKPGRKLSVIIGSLGLAILFAACTMDPDGNGSGTPTAPSKPTAQTISATSVRISWTAVSGAASYKIYRCVTSTGVYTHIDSTENNSYTDSDLSPGSTFYYKISAVGTDSIESPQSDYVSAVTSGTPSPTKVNATGMSKTSIAITWTTVSGAAKYKVYRCVTSTGVYDYVDETAERSYTDNDLTPASAYYYKVSAVGTDGVESGLSGYAVAATHDDSGNPTVPPIDEEEPGPGPGGEEPDPNEPAPALGAPYGLTATSPSKSSITVTWNAVTGAASYRIFRSSSSTGTFTQRGTSQTTSYTDTGLTASTAYYYKVAAVNTGGEGPQSAVVSAETQPNMGIIPEGYSLSQAIDYISAQIDQGTTYDITVHDNDFLDPQTVMTLGQNVTVYLHSPSADDVKTITLNSNGTLFTVDNSITLKLENIILKGRTSNDAPLVKVLLGGTLVMEAGAAITDNTNSGNGGGIYIDRGNERL
jgi:fibronectin type 3 domain-containing protein